MISPVSPTTTSRARARARRQGVVTGLVGVAALSLAALIVSALFGEFAWSSLYSLVPQVHTLAWAAIVAFALPYVVHSDRRLAVVSVALAPLVGVVAALVPYGLQGGGVFFLVAGWQALTLTCVATLGSIAGVIDSRRAATEAAPLDPRHEMPVGDSVITGGILTSGAHAARSRWDTVLSVAVLMSLIVCVALVLALPVQWFEVNFSIGQAPDPPTADEVVRYEWTAGLALAAAGLAVALAVVRRRAGLIIASAAALALGLGAAFLFQLPTGRFIPKPAPVVIDEDYPVCYGTTGDCPGG